MTDLSLRPQPSISYPFSIFLDAFVSCWDKNHTLEFTHKIWKCYILISYHWTPHFSVPTLRTIISLVVIHGQLLKNVQMQRRFGAWLRFQGLCFASNVLVLCLSQWPRRSGMWTRNQHSHQPIMYLVTNLPSGSSECIRETHSNASHGLVPATRQGHRIESIWVFEN